MCIRDSEIAEAQNKFEDLCEEGSFVQVKAFPQEQDEPEALHLPRLAFSYHRRDAGRLRQFINWLNGLVEAPSL